MYVVFIHGPAASGKLTVGRALAALSGLPLFHNHLTVDLALALFPFGSPGFVALREKVWLDTFEAAAEAGQSFIFTFHPESSVTGDFLPGAERIIEGAGGRIHYVALTCPEEEVEQRLGDESRKAFDKLTSLENYRRLRDSGAFAFGEMPEPLITIATDEVEPHDAARLIHSALATAD